MSDTHQAPGDNSSFSNEEDVESLVVSLTTSPHRLVKVSLGQWRQLVSFERLNHVTAIGRPSDSSKLRSVWQKRIVSPSAANSKMLKQACLMELSPSPSVPRPLMPMTSSTATTNLLEIISPSALSFRLDINFVLSVAHGFIPGQFFFIWIWMILTPLLSALKIWIQNPKRSLGRSGSSFRPGLNSGISNKLG